MEDISAVVRQLVLDIRALCFKDDPFEEYTWVCVGRDHLHKFLRHCQTRERILAQWAPGHTSSFRNHIVNKSCDSIGGCALHYVLPFEAHFWRGSTDVRLTHESPLLAITGVGVGTYGIDKMHTWVFGPVGAFIAHAFTFAHV